MGEQHRQPFPNPTKSPLEYLRLAARANDPDAVRAWLARAVESAEPMIDDAAQGRRQAPLEWEMVVKPYVVGGFRLAGIEWSLGNRDKALEIYRRLLVADPSDTMGVRYFLAARLLTAGLLDEFASLVERFAKDSSTYWLFNLALSAFRAMGDCSESQTVLEQAVRSNRYVPALLGGLERMGPLEERVPESGTRQEALHCAHWYAEGWRRVPGATAWIAKRASTLR